MEVKGDLNIDGTLTVNNAPVTGGSGLANVVDDTTPQLGGDLDVNGHAITATGGASIFVANDVEAFGTDSAGVDDAGGVAIIGGLAFGTGRGGGINIQAGSSVGGTPGGLTLNGNQGEVIIEGDSTLTILMGGDISFSNDPITNVADPTNPQDVATKNYVDTHASGGGGSSFYAKMSDGTEFGESLIFATSDFVKTGHIVTVQESGIDHGSLGGLADDDHPQYSLASGTRAFTGTVGGITPVATSDLATKGYVDTAAAAFGFYNPIFRESRAGATAYQSPVLIFDSAAFYVNPTSTGKPMVSFRGSSGGSSGITGIDSLDGTHNITNKTKINYNPGAFYLSQTAAGDPMVNLRYDSDIYPVYIDFPTTQQIAVIPIAPYPCTIESVQADCLSGTATLGFYIVSAANRSFARDGTGVGGLDPINLSTTFQMKLATSNVSVNTGDKVILSLYQNSASRKINVILKVKKP